MHYRSRVKIHTGHSCFEFCFILFGWLMVVFFVCFFDHYFFFFFSLSLLVLFYFSKKIAGQPDQPWANVSEWRSFIWHLLFLLVISFLLLAVCPMPRAIQDLHLMPQPKISFFQENKSICVNIFNDHILLFHGHDALSQ